MEEDSGVVRSWGSGDRLSGRGGSMSGDEASRNERLSGQERDVGSRCTRVCSF